VRGVRVCAGVGSGPLVPAKAGTQCFGQELDARFREGFAEVAG
jgi:hypothetical protein